MPAEDWYDPATCVTAEELRATGVAVPEKVPDMAWVPRASMRTTVVGSCADPADPGKVTFTLQVVFLRPFQWVAGTITLNPA